MRAHCPRTSGHPPPSPVGGQEGVRRGSGGERGGHRSGHYCISGHPYQCGGAMREHDRLLQLLDHFSRRPDGFVSTGGGGVPRVLNGRHQRFRSLGYDGCLCTIKISSKWFFPPIFIITTVTDETSNY
eukprot:1092135-Prorocentrum_minimum.AAC.1